MEPSTPTVAVTAASVANCDGGNHAAPILSAPMKVTVAPSPTTKRPAKSRGSAVATPMASEPAPITAAPAVIMTRAPNPSIKRPAGIMNPA